jgi:hypothetical protein
MEVVVKPEGDFEERRKEWTREMRKKFCQKDMIDENGNLQKEYPLN